MKDQDAHGDDFDPQVAALLIVGNKLDTIAPSASPSALTDIEVRFHALVEDTLAAISTVSSSSPPPPHRSLLVSCNRGYNVDELREAISEGVEAAASGEGALKHPDWKGKKSTCLSSSSLSSSSQASSTSDDAPVLTRSRHRYHLQQCRNHLHRFCYHQLPMETATEELRSAVMCVGQVMGDVDVEDVLEVVFRDFCVGK